MTELHSGLPKPQRYFAIVAVTFGSLMLMIDVSIAGIAMPTIAEALQIESSQAIVVVTVYQLILVMVLMPFAALGGRWGYKRMYRAGLLLHGLGAALCFTVDSLLALVLVRSLQALGTAAALSVAFGFLRDIYPAAQLGRGMALNTIANASGTALAPVFGGLLISALSWHWVFSAAVPFALLVLLFSKALPENPHPQEHSFDIRGALLCALAFGLIVGGFELLVHTGEAGVAVPVLLLGLIVGFFMVRFEARQECPVLPVDLLANSRIMFSVIAAFCAIVGSTTLLLYMPFLLQLGYSFKLAEIGGVLAAYSIASVMIAPLSSYLSDRISVGVLCSVGMIVASAGLLLVVNLHPGAAPADFAWRLWLCGAGFGMFFAPNSRFIIGSVAQHRAAAAGSVVTTVRMFGQVLGATLTAALLVLEPNGSGKAIIISFVLVALSGAIALMNIRKWTNDLSVGE